MVIFHSHVHVYQRVFDVPFEESSIVEDSWGTSQDGAWKSVIKYLGTLRHKPTGRYAPVRVPKNIDGCNPWFLSAMILPWESHDSINFWTKGKNYYRGNHCVSHLFPMNHERFSHGFSMVFPWNIAKYPWAQPGAVGHHPCVVRHQPWSLSLWQSSLETGLI